MSRQKGPPLPDLPMPEHPGPPWLENKGRRPTNLKGRVRVFLRKGIEPIYADAINKMAPPGWGADTTRWTLTGDPHDVAYYIPLGGNS